MVESSACPQCGGPRLPTVYWKDMVSIQPMTLYNKTFHAFHALLYLRESETYTPVYLKVPKAPTKESAEALKHEGSVLLRLQDVPGVPKLFGITKRPKLALVMEYLSGLPLSEYLNPEGVKTYLEALIKLCEIMNRVHAKGVAHSNIQQRYVFVERTGSKDVHTTMGAAGGFHNAILNPTPNDLHKDIEAIGALACELYRHIPSKNDLYKRRELLLSLKYQYSFKDVLNVLYKVLSGENAPPLLKHDHMSIQVELFSNEPNSKMFYFSRLYNI